MIRPTCLWIQFTHLKMRHKYTGVGAALYGKDIEISKGPAAADKPEKGEGK